MNYFKSYYPFFASVIFLSIILIAHLFASNGYNWTNHTISHLGAQKYQHRWIMQLGFLAFGIIIATGVLLNGWHLRTTPILIYGVCIALTGIFCTAPFFEVPSFSLQESQLHSIFAQVAGMAFSIGIIIQIFHTKNNALKTTHLLFFILVIGLSATFGLLKTNQGIAQRALYLVSLYWLSFHFNV